MFDTLQQDVVHTGGRSLQSIASNASLRTLESIKNNQKSSASLNSKQRSPSSGRAAAHRRGSPEAIVDKKDQKRHYIGHMATLAQQKSFYRDLKLNCIDQRSI